MAGPTKLADGTVISSNIPTRDREDFLNIRGVRDPHTYKAIIIDRYFTDDDKNKSKLSVEYKIRIVDGEKAGQEYENARYVDMTGDVANFGEMVLHKKAIRVNGFGVGLSNEADPPADYDNAFIMVSFLGGYRVPVIVGAWPHPNRLMPGAKKEDFIRLVKEFNGVRWHINKLGELIITYLGGQRTPPPQPLPGLMPFTSRPETAPTQIKIDQQGNLRVIDNELNEIRLSREDKTISIRQHMGILPPELTPQYQQGYEAEPLPINFPINEIVLDKGAEKISVVNYKPGGIESLKVEIDGSAGTIKLEDVITQAKATLGSTKFEIETGGGTKMTVDGASDEIKAKAVIGDEVTVSGPNGILAKASTGATLKLALGKVGLGGPAGELLAEFEKLLIQLDTLLTSMMTEVHPTAVGPSGPPTNAAAYGAVKAQITIIKTIIGLIKGGI